MLHLIERIRKINITFKRKLVILVLLLTLIPVLAIGIILYTNASNIITEQVSTSFMNRLKFSVQNIDSMLNSVELISYPALVDGALESKLFLAHDSQTFNEYETFNYFKTTLNGFLYANKNIDSVYLYSVAEEWFIGTPSIGRTIYGDEIKKSQWMKNVVSFPQLNKWTLLKGMKQSNGEIRDLIVNYKYIGSRVNGVPVGVMSVNIEKKEISKFFESTTEDDDTSIVVLDDRNKVITNKNSSLLGNSYNYLGSVLKNAGGKGHITAKINSTRFLIAYYVSPYTNWKYAMAIPVKSITDKVRKILILTIICFIVIMIFGIIIAFVLPSNMTKPINTLVSSMKLVKAGKFDCRITEARNDEFGELYTGFNDMVTNLDDLIHELSHQKVIKKDIQLKMMQSQINAHFLYNTLDVIHWIARINKVEDICALTFALSKYFRISLSEGKDVITLKDALELITNYMAIHKIKSEKDIHLEINIPNELLNLKVLKYIFQPIVENAIQHGIEKTRRDGILKFSCERVKDSIVFTYEDNGKGIEPGLLENIQKDLIESDFTKEGNFALKNVNNQIKMFYGERYGLTIDSEYDYKTVVKITIPFIVEEA
jgi:two-component system, sensor histidine kinase YesM